jgi:hypothetical protein
MRTGQRGEKAILQKAEEPYARSALFQWLLENHDSFKAAAAPRRLEWTVLCVEFAKEGLTDMKGQPPSPATARKTWQRVRKERARLDERRAAEEAARALKRAADPRRNMPSRITGPVGPALAEVQTQLPEGAMLWNDLYYKDREGLIQPVQNIREYINRAGAIRIKQEANLSIGRPIDDGIETLLGPRKGYGA